MPLVRITENETFDVAMRRFKRAVERAGLLAEKRMRTAHDSKTHHPAQTPKNRRRQTTAPRIAYANFAGAQILRRIVRRCSPPIYKTAFAAP